eukprot:CAMPEP_0177624924 /NCGR_PEP_ID=MMETSP0419_2-20121207/29788_1 /TAXON_ID=582737 /ORGANISM="Tetraselmis sp., Strain GSL018" /LENGTH=90 /DNA_ID=CAMNT_0019125761 /DNA_START=124 /DNA_END=392 /DNA_ORIENTATION=+
MNRGGGGKSIAWAADMAAAALSVRQPPVTDRLLRRVEASSPPRPHSWDEIHRTGRWAHWFMRLPGAGKAQRSLRRALLLGPVAEQPLREA